MTRESFDPRAVLFPVTQLLAELTDSSEAGFCHDCCLSKALASHIENQCHLGVEFALFGLFNDISLCKAVIN